MPVVVRVVVTMSKSVYFFEVSKIRDESFIAMEEVFTDSILADDILYYEQEEKCSPWMKKVGLKKKRGHTSFDPFEAATELLGTRPESYRFEPGIVGKDYSYDFEMPDGTQVTVPYSQLRGYRRYQSDTCYFCHRRLLACVDDAWKLRDGLLDRFMGRLLRRKDMLRLAQLYFKQHCDTDDAYYTPVMWDIMKAYFSCKGDDETYIVITVE